MDTGTKGPGPASAAFPDHKKGPESEVEHPKHEPGAYMGCWHCRQRVSLGSYHTGHIVLRFTFRYVIYLEFLSMWYREGFIFIFNFMY